MVRFEGDAKLLRQSGEDDVIGVGATAECLRLDGGLQLLRHAEEHDRARAREGASPVRRHVLDVERLGEHADGDVVEAGAAASSLADERFLERERRPDEHAFPLR